MIDLEDRLSEFLQRSAQAVPVRPDLDEVTAASRPAAPGRDHRAVHFRRVCVAVGTCAALVVAAIWVSARDDAETVDTAGVTNLSPGPVASGTPETAAAVILKGVFGDVVESVEAFSDVGNADTSTSRAVEVTWRDGPASWAVMVPADDQWILVELSTPTLHAQVVEAGPSYRLAVPTAGTVTIRQLLPDLSTATASDTRVEAGGDLDQAVERHRWIAAEVLSDDGSVLRDFRPVLSAGCWAFETAGWPSECILPLRDDRRLPDGTHPANGRSSAVTTKTIEPSPGSSLEDVTILVLNASGRSGVAGQLTCELQDLGMRVAPAQNSDSGPVEASTAFGLAGYDAAAQDLADRLRIPLAAAPGELVIQAERLHAQVVVIAGAHQADRGTIGGSSTSTTAQITRAICGL